MIALDCGICGKVFYDAKETILLIEEDLTLYFTCPKCKTRWKVQIKGIEMVKEEET